MLALYRLCTVDWGAIGIRKETVGAAVAMSVHLFSEHYGAKAFFQFETAELLQLPNILLDYIQKNAYCSKSNKQIFKCCQQLAKLFDAASS